AAAVKLPHNRYYSAPRAKTASGPALVSRVRHWTTRHYTRVVIHLDRPADFEHHLLPGRSAKFHRLYIDVHGARTTPRVAPRVKIDHGLLRQVRVAQFDRRTVRVVLDLKRLRRFQVFALEGPFRIVVDFSSRQAKRPVPGPDVGPDPARPRVPPGRARVKPRQWSLARQLGLKIRRVVIDAGHGGKDPGAIHGRVREKRIVLHLARLLKRQIERRLGLQVVLTRRRDRYLALEARTAKANAWAGDIFISLHVNSHPSRSIRGIETYFLNLTTDQEAMRVAARENATSTRKMSDLRMILQDLMLNSKINESNRLARFIQRGMIGHLRRRYRHVRNLGVKQAPFFVLMGAEMPAVLVEIGFISSPVERRRLINSAYLGRLALGVALGIGAYVRHINGQSPAGRRVDRHRPRWRR
ncbi:MAG: N-acetylmuramoyl-L-alanine amidase, partial [Proteobacteria bacterium]|nr:N-acetylmuramoyl-L-alanine amidase [Pseudomonadota bacterium]